MAKKVIVLDAETTGLNAKNDEILQLTILSGDGDVLFDEFIRPTKHTSWPEAEKIHHINYERVKDCEPLATYKKTISDIISSADVIVGYNHSFDMAFLEAAGIPSDPKKNYDLMLEFSQLRGEWDKEYNHYRWYKLKECADYFGYNWGTESTHNSLADCKATLYCYKKMLAGETKEGGGKNKRQHPSTFRGSFSSTGRRTKLALVALPMVAILLLGVAFSFFFHPQQTNKRKITTVTKSSLQKVLDVSDFSTLEFRYGSVAQALDDKGKVKYYVSYNGTVQIGINFEKIAKSVSVDNTNKIVTLTLPQPSVQSPIVNVDTLEYIFVKEKYNKPGLTDEALKVCQQDLSNEIQNNKEIFDIAKENAKSAITQLLDPWLKQLGDEYELVIK